MPLELKKHSKAIVFCSRCGGQGHTHALCDAEKRCSHCQQLGHIAKNCPVPVERKHTAQEAREFANYYEKEKRPGAAPKRPNSDATGTDGARGPQFHEAVVGGSGDILGPKKLRSDPMSAPPRVAEPQLTDPVSGIIPPTSEDSVAKTKRSTVQYEPPEWATVPSSRYFLESEDGMEEILLYDPEDVSASRSHYLIGKMEGLVNCVRNHSTVSRLHGVFIHSRDLLSDVDSGVRYVDLNSTCKSRIDGCVVAPHAVTPFALGSTVQFGEDTIFTLKAKSRWEM